MRDKRSRLKPRAQGRGPTRPKTWLIRLLWVLIALQVLFTARYVLLYRLFSLTGDEDPTAVIQFGPPA